MDYFHGGYVVTGETENNSAGSWDVFIAKYNNDGVMSGCPSWICQNPIASTTNPTAITTSPSATVTSPAATISSPSATVTSPVATTVLITPEIPTPPMTQTFSAQELYVAYPGESQTACKEWTAPNGKTIKGFVVSQETESGYDYFTVSLDGIEKYNKSGNANGKYIDTSASPGTNLRACMSADSSEQYGYGGEVTGVFYE